MYALCCTFNFTYTLVIHVGFFFFLKFLVTFFVFIVCLFIYLRNKLLPPLTSVGLCDSTFMCNSYIDVGANKKGIYIWDNEFECTFE